MGSSGRETDQECGEFFGRCHAVVEAEVFVETHPFGSNSSQAVLKPMGRS